MQAPPFPASERGSALLLVSCCAPYREATDRDQTPFTASLSVRQESCCRRAECLHLVVEQFDRSTSIELLTTALFKFKTETESSSMLWLCCYKTRENQPQSKEEKFDFKMTTTTTTTNLFAVGLLLLAAYPGRHQAAGKRFPLSKSRLHIIFIHHIIVDAILARYSVSAASYFVSIGLHSNQIVTNMDSWIRRVIYVELCIGILPIFRR